MRRFTYLFVGAAVLVPLTAQAQTGISDIVSSVPSASNGLNINAFVGATRFYNAGYTGSRAVVTNIEAGHIWGGDPNDPSVGHETLKAATVRLQSPLAIFNGTQLGQFDRHATWCGQAIAGRLTSTPREYQRGIAYGATLWSGAVATQWDGSTPYRTSFEWSDDRAFSYPYVTAMQDGVQTANGLRRTDVVSSSWGDSSQRTGSDPYALALDGLIKKNHTVAVFAAGNSGPSQNTIGSPANGYNAICVGASGPANTYDTVASFSSRGPQDYKGPDGTASKVRARVDIIAPGQSLVLALYNGATGGNVGASSPSLATGLYSGGLAGTSFSTPIVAGGASLLVDVGYDRYGGGQSIDGEVIKSVLLNSATRISGWTNNETMVGGVLTTTQALDYNSGAGALNLDKAFDQYTSGTHNVSGLGGGVIQGIGWDYGSVSKNGFNDYVFSHALVGGTNLTATLNWFVGRSYVDTLAGIAGNNPATGVQATDDYFTNLDLQLWSLSSGTPSSLIAQSITQYNNTEHFTLSIPTTGDYMLRVAWAGERYDLVGNTSQTFGLAWSGTESSAPEPCALALLLTGCTFGPYASRRRRLA